jgi:hypothetical protein
VLDRRLLELDLVRARYGQVNSDPECTWLEVMSFPVPAGWSRTECWIGILIPPGYPVTPPDNFYMDDNVVLASGGQPGNASVGQVFIGRQCRVFSYHVEPGTWRPSAEAARGHNLMTFLAGVYGRLAEAN